MTREESTRKVRMNPEYHYDGVYSHTETNVYDIIDQIFNDHEAQLKAKDEKIAELEKESIAELKSIQSNDCIRCQGFVRDDYCSIIDDDCRVVMERCNGCRQFIPKEQ